MQREACPKVRAAVRRAKVTLKDVTPSPSPSSGTGQKSATKKEAVALPKFSGIEKQGQESPFLQYPV